MKDLRGNLLIAHGGGPTAVINATLFGSIVEARKHGEIEGIYGARYGIEGVKDWHSRIKGVLVVASEGLVDEKGESIADTGILDGFGHKIPGRVGQALANMLVKHGLKSRSEKPGLLGRNSIALQSAADRDEAIRVGVYAVQAAMAGKT